MGFAIGIAIFDGCEELDFVGPWEVLSFWAQTWPDDDVTVFTVARTDQVVTCAKGLRVLPDHTWDSAPSLDVLVYPGGRGTRPQVTDTSIHAWLLSVREGGALMTSVCTGSLVYAAAGFLAERPATTYWASFEELLAIDPTVKPDRDSRVRRRRRRSHCSGGLGGHRHGIASRESAALERESASGAQRDPVRPGAPRLIPTY